MLVDFESPIETTDALGAPTRSWTRYAQLHAAVETEISTTTDELTNGPREESTRSLTLVVRSHMGLKLHSRMRVVDVREGDVFEIRAIRYSAKRDQAFVDVVGGQSDG
jgi:head-tail adaptor